ncbi:MAG: acyltransferase, partial [Bacteroidota bacterium]|nr:acyltransferase [Bacteroidota bacterium]
LPVPPSMDIRGWQEMHPLDGPAWSLFFEYIANILYALFIRKFSNKLLSVFVFIFGCVLIQLSVFGPNGDVIGGWSVEPSQLRIGFTRLLYPFFAGLLLSRICKPGHIKHAFFWCSLLLVIILSVPRIGGSNHLWMNGLYVSFCIIFLFPLIVYLGASGKVVGKLPSKICEFLGNISFPIYIIHYPFIYLFTAWVSNKNISLTQSLPVALIVLLASIALAYVCLKLYDIPVRKWLTKRFMGTPKK